MSDGKRSLRHCVVDKQVHDTHAAASFGVGYAFDQLIVVLADRLALRRNRHYFCIAGEGVDLTRRSGALADKANSYGR